MRYTFVCILDTFCIISFIHLVQSLYTNCIHSFCAGIHITENSCRDVFPRANVALKLPTSVFLPADGEASWWFIYCQLSQCNQKTPIPVSSR